MRAWWRGHWWIVLSALAVLAVGLAFFGSEGDLLTRVDRTLLILGGGTDAEVSTQLQIARILAPLILAYATFKAIVGLFSERIQDIRARLTRGHTIVMGLGNRGQALVESLLGSGKVVAVEIDAANPAVSRLRDAGAVVLVGDATDPELLRRAGGTRASNVVSVCGQDAANAQVAANVMRLAKGRTGDPISAFVHVGDPRLYTFLLHHAFSSPKVWLEFFNVYERGATRLLEETEPVPDDMQPPVLVLGAGQFGLALISQLARERYERVTDEPAADKLRVYLVDQEAGARATALAERYSRFRDVCDLRTFELDVESPAFDRLLERNPELRDVATAYVCFDDDGLTIASALNLLEQARGRFTVIARVTHRSEGIAALIQETQSENADATRFQAVSIAERACTADLVLEGMRGRLARGVHEAYRRDNPGTVYDVPWDELSEEGRTRNLRHADGMTRQLEAIGYRLGPLLDWGAPLPVLSSDELERMSELEHERWSAERLEQGWQYGPARNDAERLHPDLVPWGELPDRQQEINRRLLRERPGLLARVGIQLYRA